LEEEEVSNQIERTDALLNTLPFDRVYKLPIPIGINRYEWLPCSRYNYARFLALTENQMLHLANKN